MHSRTIGISKLIGIVAFVCVAWLSLAPTPLSNRDIQTFLYPYDHVVMHAVFALVCFFVWPVRHRRVFAVLLVIAVAFELIQIVLPERAFETLDLLSNIAGVSIGWVLSRVLFWRRMA